MSNLNCLTVAEVASLLSVSRSAIYEACKRGELHHVRIGDRMVVPESVLEDFIARGGAGGQS